MQAPAAAQAVVDSRPPEVAALEAFQRSHGPTGGWAPEDHDAFLKVLQACRGNSTHVEKVCEEMLLGDQETVAAHNRSAPLQRCSEQDHIGQQASGGHDHLCLQVV